MSNRRGLLLVAVAAQVLGTGVSAMTILVFATTVAGSTGATAIVVAGLAGVVVGGPLVGFLAAKLRPTRALLAGECVRFCCVAALLLLQPGLVGIAAIATCMAASDSVSISNRWQILFSSREVDEAAIHKIQQVEVAAGIVSPLAGGYVIGALGHVFGYALGGFILLLALSCWTAFCWNFSIELNRKARAWSGYATILKSRPLLGLIFLRILTGSSLVIWSIFLPSALHDLYGDSFASSQGKLAALSALAVALSGYLVTKHLAPGTQIIRTIAVAALAMLTFGMSMTAFVGAASSFTLLCLAAVAFGLYVPSIRAAIVQIGRQITPAEQVSAVISSGDSLVRTANLFLALAFGTALAVVDSDAQRAVLFFVMTAASALSVLALRLIPLTTADVRSAHG